MNMKCKWTKYVPSYVKSCSKTREIVIQPYKYFKHTHNKKNRRRHIELWSKLSNQREWQLTDTNKDKKRQRINYGVVTQVAARYVRHVWLKSFNLFVKVNSVFSFRSTSLMWQERPDAYKLCILACVSFQSTCDFCSLFFIPLSIFLSFFMFRFLLLRAMLRIYRASSSLIWNMGRRVCCLYFSRYLQLAKSSILG